MKLGELLRKEVRFPSITTKPLKDFFFPPFSERELLTLACLTYIFVVMNHAVVVPFLINFFINIPSQPLKAMLFDLFMVIMTIYCIFLLVMHAALKRPMKSFEKEVLAFYFYLGLSLFSFNAILALFQTSLNRIDLAVTVFTLVRSVLTMILLFLLLRVRKAKVFAHQLNDDQVTVKELGLIIAASSLCYIILEPGKSGALVVTLSYFYVTIALTLITSIVGIFRNTKEAPEQIYKPEVSQ